MEKVFEKDARTFAENSFVKLLNLNPLGPTENAVNVEIQKAELRGGWSGPLRILRAMENDNNLNTKKDIVDEVCLFLSALKKSVMKYLFNSSKDIKSRIEVAHLRGEVQGVSDILTKMESETTHTRGETMGYIHLYIMEKNNKIVSDFEEGSKIEVRYFTNPYLKNPTAFYL